MIQIFRLFYNFLWCVATPVLFLATRYKHGWRQRLGLTIPQGPYDIWIQSASGGESYLSLELVRELSRQAQGHKTRILLSSGTPQGIGVLQAGIKRYKIANVDVVYFPIDAPFVMERVFSSYQPRQVVIVETELWPALLMEAKRLEVPVHLVNGRMSEKSHRSYGKIHNFFRHYGPHSIYAISEGDFRRFQNICSTSKVHRMNNIKFDRLRLDGLETGENIGREGGLRKLFPEQEKIIVLGSVRRQEEAQILELIERVLVAEQGVSIALFPKHESRALHLCKELKKLGLGAQLRSELHGHAKVVVWDSFGELTKAYHSADAVFVGGTLEKLGGQNFLEPLIAGVRPIIGPYYHNFLWVGEEVFEMGLVQQVTDSKELYSELLQAIHRPVADDFTVRMKFYLQQKQGGTALVVTELLQALHSKE